MGYDVVVRRINKHIAERKMELYAAIERDHRIDTDPYDNVARLKEVEKVEKLIQEN